MHNFLPLFVSQIVSERKSARVVAKKKGRACDGSSSRHTHAHTYTQQQQQRTSAHGGEDVPREQGNRPGTRSLHWLQECRSCSYITLRGHFYRSRRPVAPRLPLITLRLSLSVSGCRSFAQIMAAVEHEGCLQRPLPFSESSSSGRGGGGGGRKKKEMTSLQSAQATGIVSA